MIDRSLAVRTHGRYVVSVPAGAGPWPLLVACHGYAENAAIALDRAVGLDPDGSWLRVGVQGLHRFYRGRSRDVVASWMTHEDREQAIADNTAYLASVVNEVAGEWPATDHLVFSGFSQGVAMAFRAAAASRRRVDAVVALGGDIPPEIDRDALARLPRVLIGHGSADPWYTNDKIDADVRRLQDAGVACDRCEFDGPHEWSAVFTHRAIEFLQALPRA